MHSQLWVSFDPEKRQDLAQEAQSLVSPFDQMVIRGEENGSIDLIRELQRFLSRQPTQSDFNLGLLTEVHYLSLEAQNALLKTLEEPPSKSHLILIAPSPSHLLPTVVSRCQVREETTTTGKTEVIDWELLTALLTSGEGRRLSLSDTIDLKNWLFSWQTLLHQKLALKPSANDLSQRLKTKDIYRYLKILLRLQKLQDDHVNPKLLASVLALSAPKLAS